jgi:hypothetical protein
MCLVPKADAKIEIAQFDIPVFKVLRRLNKKFVSPYRDTLYAAGETYSVDKFTASVKGLLEFNTSLEIPLSKVEIFQGIHSYTSFFEASREADYKGSVLIVLAAIPKGTAYILGNKEDVVSLSLKIESAIGNDSLANEFNGVITTEGTDETPQIGDRVLVVKADSGALGAEGQEGVVTSERSTSGLNDGNGLNVKLDGKSLYGNNVWSIGKNAKVKILAKPIK